MHRLFARHVGNLQSTMLATVSDKGTDSVNQSRIAEDDDISNISDTYRNMLEQNVDNSELKELQLKLEEKNKEVESLKLYINEF